MKLDQSKRDLFAEPQKLAMLSLTCNSEGPTMQRVLTILLTCLCSFLSISSLGAEELGPGDTGFRHQELHPYYQQFFDSNRCHCGTGECRPTLYRSSATSESGVEVLMDGQWYSVPKSALISPKEAASALHTDPAHACGYWMEDEFYVECVIINSAG